MSRFPSYARVFVGLGLLCALLAFVQHHREVGRADALLRAGQQTTGVVTAHGHVYKGRDYELVDFAADHTTYRGRLYARWSAHPIGERLTVYYDASDPFRFRTAGDRNLKGADHSHLTLLYAGAFVLTFTGILTPWSMRRSVARRHARRG